MRLTFPTILAFIALFGSLQLSGQSTSLMTFNIRYDNPGDKEDSWDNRKEDVVELIQYYHPDFLGIQEGVIKQVSYIDEYTSKYKYIGVGRDDGAEKGEFCAIFYDSSKFELVTHRTFWLSDSPDKISVGWDASMERICTFGSFKDKRTADYIYVFNTHFDHIGEEARERSAALILQKISEFGLLDSKVVLMGDFNASPESKAIGLLKQGMDHGYYNSIEKFYGPEGTFNGFKNNIELTNRIDYIFTKNIAINKYCHIDDKRKNNRCVSDHLPVLIEILNRP
jgi:endonuclease/exonuclease/phosphatase family metal-dependent hydrolase